MSDHLDDRIRALFEELDEASPEAPPMPMPPGPEQRPVWQRRLVPAMGLAVVVLVMGVAAQLMFRGTTSDDSEATATTEAAAEGGGGPAETRPPGFALVLADLNLACTRYVQASSDTVPVRPIGDQAYLDALKALVEPTSTLSSSITSAAEAVPGSGIDEPADTGRDLVAQIERSAGGPAADAQAAYDQYVDDVDALGSELADLGALDCADIAGPLP